MAFIIGNRIVIDSDILEYVWLDRDKIKVKLNTEKEVLVFEYPFNSDATRDMDMIKEQMKTIKERRPLEKVIYNCSNGTSFINSQRRPPVPKSAKHTYGYSID